MKIRFRIGIGVVNADKEDEINITPEELGDMTLEEYCDQYLQDMLSNCLDMSWWKVEDEQGDLTL